ncbi:hypothetical protein PCANC_18397 [Puccinia coronata f. sp. avenae]|uniref:Uncharacterized protein n=1 Tax=Puccinia coronata f. sp. avenae TaxID=200324 RepID=A0A2N5TTP3_9BASI|nr:hypothetical protein PCANC_18397 [Puccinia coronata f. sp. avenae]
MELNSESGGGTESTSVAILQAGLEWHQVNTFGLQQLTDPFPFSGPSISHSSGHSIGQRGGLVKLDMCGTLGSKGAPHREAAASEGGRRALWSGSPGPSASTGVDSLPAPHLEDVVQAREFQPAAASSAATEYPSMSTPPTLAHPSLSRYINRALNNRKTNDSHV